MKKLKEIIYIGLVLTIAGLMCVQAGALSNSIKTHNQNSIIPISFPGETRVSTGDDDDLHPRMCTGPGGVVVVAFEQTNNLFSKVIPVAYTDDGGETFTTQFEFDSFDFTSGSGVLQYPDIVYNSNIDQYFLSMVDPYAEMYSDEMAFIPGDITTAEEANWYGISGSGSTNYNYQCAGATENFHISVTTEDGYDMIQIFGLGYFTYPDFENPEVMGGFYYDGNSEHQSAPGAEIEMDVGSERVYIACETDGQITVKSTSSDEELLTNGEMQNGMDKYADIEQYPGEYISSGTDPDVATSGARVSVVYVDGGNVKCSYSPCDGSDYDPGHSWQTSTVATGAAAPAVHQSGNTVYCGYVKDGNAYKIVSEDGGASWGTPDKMNSADGTVSSEAGSLDIKDTGIVWTDTRNGDKDIYFVGGAGGPIIEVQSIAGGFGVSAVIGNDGADANDIDWSIELDGSLVFIGGLTEGTISSLSGGSTETISTGLVFGLGGVDITVSAGGSTSSASGTILGPFVIGL